MSVALFVGQKSFHFQEYSVIAPETLFFLFCLSIEFQSITDMCMIIKK